jgi:CBS domain
MADAPAEHPAPPPATVADIKQPPVTTVELNDHVAAAAHLMKRANATALIVTHAQTGQPVGIITDADVSHAVADGKNLNDVRIYHLMTANPTVVSTTTSIPDAAEVMTSKRFRHLRSSETPAWSALWISPTYAAHCLNPATTRCPPRRPATAKRHPNERSGLGPSNIARGGSRSYSDAMCDMICSS